MRLPCLGVVVVVAFASTAFGDGCYMPVRAFRKMPEIPAQRAVVAWKDGQETLLISSALDSESQRLGWLIPVPAVPETIEKEGPGSLKTLSACIQPRVTHDLTLEIHASLLVMFVGNLLLGTWLFKRKRFLDLLLLLLLLFVLSALFLPASGTASAGVKAANVLVEKTATVGSYDISVLRPSQSSDLNAWLAENGFASLPAAADPIVADYISQGWVFAAIQLTRAESGANAPHPIKMTFPAKRAVYPLRLTALAGGSPQFEIFVVADQMASCDSLEAEFCDRFAATSSGSGRVYESTVTYRSVNTYQAIGHPAICGLMWDGCVLTKLAGSINAHDMTGDIAFDWMPLKVYQQRFFSAAGAWDSGVLLFILLVGGWVFVSMLAFRKRISQPGGRRWHLGRVILPVLLVGALGVGAVAKGLPTLKASEVIFSFDRWPQRSFANRLCMSVETLFRIHPEALRGTAPEIADYILKSRDVAELLKEYDGHRASRIRPGTPTVPAEVKVEDSPGNLTVEKQPDKVIVRVYDDMGRVLICEFPVPSDADDAEGT